MRGASLEISGTIPRGAGLSSSAALEVALALALLALADADVVPPWPLARICSRVENEWVGAQTGLLDQLASLCGHEHAAMRIDFRSGVIEPVPLRARRLAAGHARLGRVGHTHAQSGYNERRARVRAGLRGARDLEPARTRAGDARAAAARRLTQRARHVFEENARVDAAVDALARGDLPELGRLLDASHASLRDLYEVSARRSRRPCSGAARRRRRRGADDGRRLRRPGARADAARRAAHRPARSRCRPGPGARVLER